MFLLPFIIGHKNETPTEILIMSILERLAHPYFSYMSFFIFVSNLFFGWFLCLFVWFISQSICSTGNNNCFILTFVLRPL